MGMIAMFKMAIDASYLVPLIDESHEKHKLAHKMVSGILDSYRLCIPIEEYGKVFDTFRNCDPETKKKIREGLMENLTIIAPKNDHVINALNTFNYYDHKISYSDCIILEYLKEREINYIISFDDKWDMVDEIKRVYGLKNRNRLYFPN